MTKNLCQIKKIIIIRKMNNKMINDVIRQNNNEINNNEINNKYSFNHEKS